MGLFGSDAYPVTAVTEDMQHRVAGATEAITSTTEPDALGAERALVQVRPFGDSEGFDVAGEFTRDLYRSEWAERTDRASIEAMEWWFTDGQLSQRYCTATPDRFEQIVSSRYEHSSLHTPEQPFLTLTTDEYVASARLHLQQDCAFPIAHQETRISSLSRDPYTALASALVGDDDTQTLVQCVFTPVDDTWYQRGWYGSWASSDVDDMAERRKEGTVKGEINPRVVESRTDRQTARDMQRQRGQPAFQTTVRVVATAPTKAAVRERLGDLIGAFEAFTYPPTEQGFVAEPWAGDALSASLVQAAGRDLGKQGWLKRALFGREMVLTADELAGLVHLPNRDINAPLLDWERMESGAGAPGAGNQYPRERAPATERNPPPPSTATDRDH
jgi:hypothetical protein